MLLKGNQYSLQLKKKKMKHSELMTSDFPKVTEISAYFYACFYARDHPCVRTEDGP